MTNPIDLINFVAVFCGLTIIILGFIVNIILLQIAPGSVPQKSALNIKIRAFRVRNERGDLLVNYPDRLTADKEVFLCAFVINGTGYGFGVICVMISAAR